MNFDTLTEAYLYVLNDVYKNGELIEELNKTNDINNFNDNYYYNKQATKEIINYSFTINNLNLNENITTNSSKYNEIIKNYHERETELFDNGDIFNMHKLSNIWKIIENPDGSINANYGYMVYHLKDAGNEKFSKDDLTNQWDWAKSRLILDKNTLQAYLHFNRPKDQWKGNLDQPCTMFIQFVIRKDKLNLYGYMRSNDIIYGMPYNILYFIKLMYRMLDELKINYPNLTIGSYTHNTTSVHYYLRNENRLIEMIN